MRKHFYLITESERGNTGDVLITDKQLQHPLKNEEGPRTVFDDDACDYKQIGKQVGLGYYDFDDEDDYESNCWQVIDSKLNEIDRKWVEKAGLDPQSPVAEV